MPTDLLREIGLKINMGTKQTSALAGIIKIFKRGMQKIEKNLNEKIDRKFADLQTADAPEKGFFNAIIGASSDGRISNPPLEVEK